MTKELPRVRAPELARDGLIWLNTDAPWTKDRLAGRLVILDFWTFCCINCLQVLPTLARLERRFPEEVAVIGVHSPKFQAEKDPTKVAAAIRRYGIGHPVVHDPDMRLWQEFGVRAWPTLAVIDPDGYVVGATSGEPDPDALEELIAGMVAQHRAGGRLAPGGALVAPAAPEPGRFHFPAKLKALPEGGFVLADAGNHQIVVLSSQGDELVRYGSGLPGAEDGEALHASFHRPEGVAADEDAIWVADTGNHLLRRIDRASGLVITVAGTGQRGPALAQPTLGLEQALASPWDVEVFSGAVLFCNAGTHQLGLFDPSDGSVTRLAGSGREAISDGFAPEAALAQPSGLAALADCPVVFFADSETSSIRALVFRDKPEVATIIGTGLFDFGHVNGSLDDGRLQHPLGLAVDGPLVFVADSYNDTVRVIDLARQQISDLDDGYTCTDAVCRPLNEPAGIALDAEGAVLVVDTNHHRILRYDPATRTSRTWAE
ncbi:MAG: thioredoxin-like domain-containing protein [Alphaproteobacteria bacterium]|nr:thioredoxin-like domain-containing protein [Alphaproteobacteria bacterium]